MEATTQRTETSTTVHRGWGLCIAVLALLAVLFLKVHRLADKRGEQAPLVVADPARLDFGERWEGETFTWTVPIRNTTTAPVDIQEFRTSCGCIDVSPKQLKLAAGATAELTLSIRSKPDREAKDGTTQQISLTGFGTDQRDAVLSSYLRGRVNTLLDLDPQVVRVPAPVIAGRKSAPVRVRVVPRTPSAAVRVEAGAGIHTDVRQVGPGYELDAQVHPAAPGPWTGTIHVVIEGERGRVIGKQPIPLMADVVTAVEAVPSDRHFGVVGIGSVSEDTVTLRSMAGTTFTVEGWTTSTDLGVSPTDRRHTYRVRYAPQGQGEQAAEAHCRVILADGERVNLRLKLGAYVRP